MCVFVHARGAAGDSAVSIAARQVVNGPEFEPPCVQETFFSLLALGSTQPPL
jgi:hypothetical protein